MKCALKGCPGGYEERLVALTVRLGDELVVIDDVPAEVCRECGDRLFTPETNEKIDRLIEGRGEEPVEETAPVYHLV